MPFEHPIFGELISQADVEAARKHDELLGTEEDGLAVDPPRAKKLAKLMPEFVSSIQTEVQKKLKGDAVLSVVGLIAQALLTRSHIVVEGASGTGKTVAVTSVAKVLGMPWQRIDAMPDLPDIEVIGGEVFKGGAFHLLRGKLLQVVQVLIVDEFGRLSPTAANAFLQALEEREVGVTDFRQSGKSRWSLSPAFTMAAAMNPQNYGGSGGINEALFDRISAGVRMPMPGHDGLVQTLAEVRHDEPELKAVTLPCKLHELWAAINHVAVPEPLIDAVISANYYVSPPEFRKANGWDACKFKATSKTEKKEVTRLEEDSARLLFEGSNPRGMVLTVRRAKANAFFRGAMIVSPEDVRQAAQAALLFRLKSFPGTSPQEILEIITRAVNLTLPSSEG
jgi:MoxR-like ATPase